ncbi:UNVERIFIED_CONTAM: hypothetical protein GTU68_044297, partial [Idotea baltica]|nr:hypothetical protein [Idotea baltica]
LGYGEHKVHDPKRVHACHGVHNGLDNQEGHVKHKEHSNKKGNGVSFGVHIFNGVHPNHKVYNGPDSHGRHGKHKGFDHNGENGISYGKHGLNTIHSGHGIHGDAGINERKIKPKGHNRNEGKSVSFGGLGFNGVHFNQAVHDSLNNLLGYGEHKDYEPKRVRACHGVHNGLDNNGGYVEQIRHDHNRGKGIDYGEHVFKAPLSAHIVHKGVKGKGGFALNEIYGVLRGHVFTKGHDVGHSGHGLSGKLSGHEVHGGQHGEVSHHEGHYGGYSISAPTPYKYEYGIHDPHYGSNFGHSETGDGYNVKGQYYVHLPDGRIQKVSYFTDEWGYHPTITYEGIAHHPAPKKGHDSGYN